MNGAMMGNAMVDVSARWLIAAKKLLLGVAQEVGIQHSRSRISARLRAEIDDFLDDLEAHEVGESTERELNTEGVCPGCGVAHTELYGCNYRPGGSSPEQTRGRVVPSPARGASQDHLDHGRDPTFDTSERVCSKCGGTSWEPTDADPEPVCFWCFGRESNERMCLITGFPPTVSICDCAHCRESGHRDGGGE